MQKSMLLQSICALLTFLFVYTALSKLHDLPRFAFVLSKSPMIGSASDLVALFIPLVELGIATLLLVPRTKRFGLYASVILLLLFTFYVSYMVVFVPHLPCSCGGVIQKMSWKQHLLFNTLFTGLALCGLRLSKTKAKDPSKGVVYT